MRGENERIARDLTALWYDTNALEFQSQVRKVLDAKDAEARKIGLKCTCTCYDLEGATACPFCREKALESRNLSLEAEVAKFREAVLEAHPDGLLVKCGDFKGEFDFVEAIKWLGKEFGASVIHQCEPQEIIFTDDDGEERELEYVVGDGPEYDSPSGYCVKEPHPKIASLEKQVKEMREALDKIIHELGVPQPDYPAPIVNAYDIAQAALRKPERQG